MILSNVWQKPTSFPVKRMVLVFLCAVMALSTLFAAIQPLTASAAGTKAIWGANGNKSIQFKGKTYDGPYTNSGGGTDKNGGNWRGDKGAIYFRETGAGPGIIWFPKGTDVGKATSATLIKLDWRPSTGTGESYYVGVKQSDVTFDFDPVQVAIAAVKGAYKSGIQKYASQQCQAAAFFPSPAEKAACRTAVNKRFDVCFNGMVSGKNGVRFTFNEDKPGSSIDTAALADCIASSLGGAPVGKAKGYLKHLDKAKGAANKAGAEAYAGAVPEKTDDDNSSCKIDGIGWIICPVSNFLAGLTDNVFKLVSGLLEVKVVSSASSNSSLYSGWQSMRNFANVAFVIAFLIIIMSQLTSIGINNYGIKKILPRLVIAAILVNVSFWICAIAVDLSNIIGYSMQDLFMGLRDNAAQATNKTIPTWQAVTTNVLSAGAIGAAAVGAAFVMTSSAAMLGLLGLIWPLLIAALFSVLVTLILLTARQALIVILIVISPLAFVAFLLPNTEKWFTRWRDLLFTMLIMFPLIAILFGGSQYAAALIMASSSEAPVIILALAVQVIPLAITPFIVKLSGSLLGKFGGMLNNPAKGPFDRLKNSGSEAIKKRQETAAKRDLSRNNPNFRQKFSQRKDDKARTRTAQNKKYDTRTDARWDEKVTQDAKLTQISNETTAEASRGSEAQKVQRKQYLDALSKRDENGDIIRDSSDNIVASELLTTAAGIGGATATNRIKSAVDQEDETERQKAIQDIEGTLDLKLAPGAAGILDLQNKFIEDFSAGRTDEARAAQNILLGKRGQAGHEAYRKAMLTMDDTQVKNTDGTMSSAADSETFKELRRDILGKHAGVKAVAIDINALGIKGGKLGDIQKDAGTFGISDEELTGQKPSTIKLALAANAISPTQAARILDSPDLSQRLDNAVDSKTGRSQRDEIAALASQAPKVKSDAEKNATNTENNTNNNNKSSTDGSTLTIKHEMPNPATSRTTASSTANYAKNEAGLFVPPASDKPVKVKMTNPQTAPQPAPAIVVPPTDVKVTVNQVPSQGTPGGQRSSGVRVDTASGSTRTSTTGPAHAGPVQLPPDNAGNTDMNRF